MSGGVDSSLAAALLKEEEYEVIGLTLKMHDGGLELGGSGEADLDSVSAAGRAARSMGIPHRVLDVRGDFQEKVIDYFIEDYRQGRTPNPCIICNREIKFATLERYAREQGADYIATGHYARVEYSPSTGRYLLRKGVDIRKDQSYMLFNLSQVQLSRCLFPLGFLTKQQCRQARQFNLRAADRAESQEICFIPDNDYRQFLRQRDLPFTPDR